MLVTVSGLSPRAYVVQQNPQNSHEERVGVYGIPLDNEHIFVLPEPTASVFKMGLFTPDKKTDELPFPDRAKDN